MTQCPFCKEEIQEGARVCKHCGKTIESAGRKQAKAVLGIALGAITVGCMCSGLTYMIDGTASAAAVSLSYGVARLVFFGGVVLMLIGLILRVTSK